MKRVLSVLLVIAACLLAAGYIFYPFFFGTHTWGDHNIEVALPPATQVVKLAQTAPEAAKAPLIGSERVPMQVASRNVTISVYMRIQVNDVNSAHFKLYKIASQYGGYVQSSSIYEGGGYVTLRVPAERLENALEDVRKIGEIEKEERNVEDVTEQILDLETRLRNLRATESRLLELLSKAEKIEDILAIEDKLSQVRQQIEWLEANRKNLHLMVNYATISVELRKEGYTPPEEDPLSRIWEDSRKAFLGSLYLLIVGASFLALPMILIALAYAIYTRARRSRQAIPREMSS